MLDVYDRLPDGLLDLESDQLYKILERPTLIHLEGGDRGGEVIAEGTPEQVAKVKKSYTGKYLKQVLAEYPHSKA